MTITPRRLALSLSLAILLPLAPTQSAAKSPSDTICQGESCQKTAALDSFLEALSEIRKKYVDEVDEEELIEAAIEGMIDALDKHSRYFEPDRLEAVRARLRGEYGGIGIRVAKEDGRIKVLAPLEGMPAFQAGLRSGDIITHLDGNPLGDLELSEAIDRMRGPRGTEIAMTIQRDGVGEPFEVTLTRETINVQSVRYRAEGRIGYIQITRFDRQTQNGLETAIEAIETELGGRVSGYVLDLRGNPGGLVSQAISVSDSFLEGGRIVTTRGRHRTKNRRYDAVPGDLAHGLPIVVLINGRSASASEIVAGALQDHHRAIVLGSRSYGKGTVQSTISLDNHGAIRITTARYYTPSGRSIHQTGIVPDVVVEQPDTEASATDGDDEGGPGPLPADEQLTRAVELLCGLGTAGAFGDRAAGSPEAPHHGAAPTMIGAPSEAAAAGQPSSPDEEADIGAACTAHKPVITANLPANV